MPKIRSRFKMAAILAVLNKYGEDGLTLEDIQEKTEWGKSVSDNLHHLKKEGWIRRVGTGNRYAVTPDHAKPRV